MSQCTSTHCACPTPEIINIPGVEGGVGTAGLDGTNGQDGINAFTLIATPGFSVPLVGGSISIPVLTSVWMAIGQNIFVQGGGYYNITAIPSTASVTATRLGYAGSAAFDGGAPAAGATVSPAATQPALTGMTPLSVSDGTLTASDTIAVGIGRITVAFYIPAPDILTGDLLGAYVLGYAFKLLKFDARCADAVTTGGKASDVSLKINGTPTTGGVISLSGTYALGSAQAGTAITAANTGNAAASITIAANTSSAFIQGAFWLILELQNMDTANAFASIAAKLNNAITQLS